MRCRGYVISWVLRATPIVLLGQEAAKLDNTLSLQLFMFKASLSLRMPSVTLKGTQLAHSTATVAVEGNPYL